MMPKVSVLMPAYNAEPYIAEAIGSILDQTFTDFELIIVDDGSTDSTPGIVAAFSDPRIRCERNEKNLGIVGALNRALALARGAYIARMDADDVSDPERLSKQVAYMDEHPECIVCGARMRLFGAKRGETRQPSADPQIRAAMFFSNPFAHPTVMIRASVLGQAGLKYREGYEGIEDFRLWADLLKADGGVFFNFPEPLLKYRVHAGQITQRKPSPKRAVCRETIVRDVFSHFAVGSLDEYPVFAKCVTAGIERWDGARMTELIRELARIAANCPPELRAYVSENGAALALRGMRDLSGRELVQCRRLFCKTFRPGFRTVCRLYCMMLAKICRGRAAKLKERAAAIRRRSGLRTRDFSIVSNNCWGGLMYQKYGLPYRSPTCGLLILGSDYISFCRNLRDYLHERIRFIPFEESKYHDADFLEGMRFPVGVLKDIEIYFVHYKTEEEAAEKWYRRCERINWNRIVYKISERETFSEKDMQAFAALDLPNRLIFASKSYTPDTIVIDGLDRYVGDETPLIEERFDELTYFNNLV